MKESDLYRVVSGYGKATTPMHMPGHKRNTEILGDDLPYGADITEIEGFDNLHAPEENGILARLADRAAALYRAKRAFPLINGSTCGLLAAIRALAEPQSEILIARNCHKSVYHAIELTGLRHISVLPPTDAETGIYGSIRPSDIEAALDANPAVRTVVVTSPTYEGVISDIGAIADTVHRHGAKLVVDGAHGAHFGFSEGFPPFPVSADIVVTSLHKTLPSLTQTALALVFTDDTAVSERLARELSVFETSSPSYILLASIHRCVSLLEARSAELFADYEALLREFYRKASDLKQLSVMAGDRALHPEFYGFDRGKLMIFSHSDALSGPALADRLRREFAIEPEMAYADYVLCMTSICDTRENLDRLIRALFEIDASLSSRHTAKNITAPPDAPKRAQKKRGSAVISDLPQVKMTISEAIALAPAPLAAGEMSRMYAWVYPPGIPLVVPGEEVSENTLQLLRRLEAVGLTVRVGR